jgi:Transglycosylase-like domain
VRFRKLWPAAAVAIAAGAPAGLALAAEQPAPGPSIVSPALTTPIAGDASAREAMREAGIGRHVREHVRLSRKLTGVGGPRISRLSALKRANRASTRGLRAMNAALRRDIGELDVPIPPVLARIAECESHGNPQAIGGGGMYRGKYQFSVGTWAAVGGKGDPAKASEAEQDRRAAMLLARSGTGQWPVCGA